MFMMLCHSKFPFTVIVAPDISLLTAAVSYLDLCYAVDSNWRLLTRKRLNCMRLKLTAPTVYANRTTVRAI